MHGITEDVFLSLPTVVGANGIEFIIQQDLKSDEVSKLRESANTLMKVQKSLNL